VQSFGIHLCSRTTRKHGGRILFLIDVRCGSLAIYTTITLVGLTLTSTFGGIMSSCNGLKRRLLVKS
jgi:hypothetical protein